MQAKKLNQVLALEKAIKTKHENAFTQAYQNAQKEPLFLGLVRTYNARTEDGEKLPAEKKLVTLKVTDLLETAATSLKELLNLSAVKDATNATAKGDVVIDGKTVLKDVPATHLVFIEKRLTAIIEFISKLPTLSQDASWQFNSGLGLYETAPVDTFKTKKVERWETIVPPTKEHPAQAQKLVEDVVVGTWSSIALSGAVPADRKATLLARAEKVQRAVKIAREEANQAPVVELSTGELVDIIFAP